jgi:hypothetical protein
MGSSEFKIHNSKGKQFQIQILNFKKLFHIRSLSRQRRDASVVKNIVFYNNRALTRIKDFTL